MVPAIPTCEDDQFPKFTSSGPVIGSLILLIEDEEHDKEAEDLELAGAFYVNVKTPSRHIPHYKTVCPAAQK